MSKPPKIRSIFLRLLPFLVAGLCIVAIGQIIDWKEALGQFGQFPAWLLVMCVLGSLLRNWLMAERWLALLPKLNRRMSAFDAFRYVMLSGAYSLLLPGAFSGDFLRSVHVAVELKEYRSLHVLSIWLDRIIGLMSIMILGMAAALFAVDMPYRLELVYLSGTGIIFMVLGVYIACHPGILVRLHRLSELLGKMSHMSGKLLSDLDLLAEQYRKRPRMLVKALAWCIPIHLLWFFITYGIAQELKFEIGFFPLSVIAAISMLITAIPISIGGIGVREISLIFLLNTQGIGAESATTLSLTQFSVLLVTALLGILFFGRWRPRLVSYA